MFANQQIVTGIAVLTAGLSKISDISLYHFHLVVYLTWMSSNVHLTSLTILQPILQANKMLKIWRITGMLVLMAMLFVALMFLVNANMIDTVGDSLGISA